MKKLICILCFAAFGIALNSCDSNDDSSSSGNYSFKVRMTDAPGPYEEVNIDLQAVQVIGNNGQTVTLNTTAGIYNLLDYFNGVNTIIASSTLTDAHVGQVRLILGSNNTVVVDGVTYPLSTPSAEQSGLKVLVNQTLEANVDNEILLDFDANASVIQTGNGTYKLKPVIRTVQNETTGTISGTIAPGGILAVVTATSSTNVEYSSGVNILGQFQISGLPPGNYSLTITPALPLLPATETNVVVTAGSSTAVGTITLQ